MNELMKLLRLGLADVAARTGLTEGYVKQLSAGNRGAGPEVAPKLARLFRERAAELVEEAPRAARQMRADARALAAAADQLDPPSP